MEDKCVFCKIIRREIPASIVYEDEQVIAFMDINPINPGHVLVVPRQHYAALREVPEALAMHTFRTVLQLEKAIWEAEDIVCEGTNLLQNNGRAAWQDVFHVHFHIVPRFRDDQFKIKYVAGKPSRADLDNLASRIKAAAGKLS